MRGLCNERIWNQWGNVVIEGLGQTLVMVFVALGLSIVIGIPLGVLLVIARPGGLNSNLPLYSILNSIINVLRSLSIYHFIIFDIASD